jgi:hypothetical protein
VPAGSATRDLFGEDLLPEGMKYQIDFLSREEERVLLQNVKDLPFKEFEFHSFIGKRRTISFGWRYDFNGGGLARTDDIDRASRSRRNLCRQSGRQFPAGAGDRVA